MYLSTTIAKAVTRAQARIDNASPADKAKAETTLRLDDYAEYTTYQDVKSWAHASGIIPLDVAQDLYSILGETMEQFHAEPLASRLVCMKAMGELLGLKIKTARA